MTDKEILQLAAAELTSMYKRLGIKESNVLTLINQSSTQTDTNNSLPKPEQSKKAMLSRKIKFVDSMDKFSSRKNAYKQGWKDCYEWIKLKIE